MDYARKIGKQKSDTWPKLRDCVPQKTCHPRKSSTPLQEDRRLANWKRWLADRERRQKYLAAALKREPIDLVLNSHERVRGKNETKCLVEAASRTEVTNQDRYRGNPVFWKTEERLRKECQLDDSEDEDDVVVRRSRVDRFLPPDVTRVALPEYIRREKMLIDACGDAKPVDLNTKWSSGAYLKHRATQLKRELECLEPKQPETENLIVVGANFDCREKGELVRVPVITITPDESKPHPLRDPDDRAALRVQDREFVLESARHFEKLSRKKTLELQEANEDLNGKRYIYSPFDCDSVYEILPKRCKPITWSLQFVAKDAEICERRFCLENRGVRVVHVEWREATPSFLPISLPDRMESHFFFNKNRISILPGQKIEVPVWFRADRPIFATETWKLIVDPKVYPGTMLLRLWATSNGEEYKLDHKRKFEDVKAKLKARADDSMIREIVADLFATATTESQDEDMPYEMYFLESELFRARNPEHHYKPAYIAELKRMHADLTGEADWDLSLYTLRSALLKVEDATVRREKFLRFQSICQECLVPDLYYTRPRPSKYKLVYALLCMFVNQFEDEDYYVMRCCCSEVAEDDDSEEEERGVPEMEGYEESEVYVTCRNLAVYQEAMYERIYCLLRETVDKICVGVESCEFFNK